MTNSYKKQQPGHKLTRNEIKNRQGNNPPSVLNGVAVTKIAEWCKVSLATARHWVRGNRHPSRQALELIELHTSGRVMPDSRPWAGLVFDNNRLHCSNGDSFSPAQLESYRTTLSINQSLHNQVEQLQAQIRQAEDYIQYLEHYAERAAVLHLDKEKMRASLSENVRPGNPYFDGKSNKNAV